MQFLADTYLARFHLMIHCMHAFVWGVAFVWLMQVLLMSIVSSLEMSAIWVF